MKAQPEPLKKARAHRSQAFLEMYRGRYDLAIAELRQAIVINATLGATISEFRDRLILTRALDAKGRSREAGVELAAVDRLIARLSLGPEWLRFPAAIQARRGDVRRARRLVDLMTKTSGAATADSTTNRNIAQDRGLCRARSRRARACGRQTRRRGQHPGSGAGGRRIRSADRRCIGCGAARRGKPRRRREELRGGHRESAARPRGTGELVAGTRQARRGLPTARPARRRPRAIRATGRTVEGRGLRSRRITGSQSASFALKWVIPQPPEREPGHLRFGEANTLGTLGDASRSWRKAVAQASEDW